MSNAEPVERLLTALVEPMYDLQAQRRGQHFSRRLRIPGVQGVSEIAIGDPFGAVTMDDLAEMHRDRSHPMRREVSTTCSQGCGATLTAMEFFSSVVACDDCIKKAQEAANTQRARAYWESICPDSIRETKLDHPDFPRAQYEMTRDWKGATSLLFLGPTRLGKTRLAFTLLKRVLVHQNMHVGVMWDEDLAATKTAFLDRVELIKKWGRFDVLLIDDGLIAGARDEKITSFLKSLLDYILRFNRRVIITSQLTSADYMAELKKWDEKGTKATEGDTARVGAVLSRIKEMCGDPIPFNPRPALPLVNATDADQPF